MAQPSVWKPNQHADSYPALGPGNIRLPRNPCLTGLSKDHENALCELICTAIFGKFGHFNSTIAIAELGAATHLSVAIAGAYSSDLTNSCASVQVLFMHIRAQLLKRRMLMFIRILASRANRERNRRVSPMVYSYARP